MKRSVSRSSRFWCLGSGFSGRRPRRMISGSSCCSMVLVQPSAPSITTVESSSSSSRRWQSSRSVSAARADRMAEESSWCDAFTSEVSGRATKEDSHEGSIYRALCEPLLNSTKLLSLMESLLEAGETPSVQLMESLADELSESRDVKATRVSFFAASGRLLLCLKCSTLDQGSLCMLHSLCCYVETYLRTQHSQCCHSHTRRSQVRHG